MHTGVNRKAVAAKIGLSESTVSRALSGSPLIPETTRAIVRKAAEALGYTPNRQAALLSRQRTCRIGLVIPQHRNIPPFSRSYFPMILDGAVLAAEDLGYFVTIILEQEKGRERDLVKVVKSREVDALLLSILKTGDPRIAKLKENGVPFALVNSEAPGVNCVNHDARPGMEKAFEHLAEKGHRKIGFVSGDMAYLNAVERLQTARELSLRHRMELKVVDGDFSRTSGYLATGKLLTGSTRVTAVVTSSDREALGVLEYCRDHEIAVPRDVSVVGFDDFDSVSLIRPILTAVSNPVREASMEAVRLLVGSLEKKSGKTRIIRINTDFVPRESTGPCPK